MGFGLRFAKRPALQSRRRIESLVMREAGVGSGLDPAGTSRGPQRMKHR